MRKSIDKGRFGIVGVDRENFSCFDEEGIVKWEPI